MISKALDKSTCAECRFCCEFDKTDSWEIPIVLPSVAKRLEKKKVKVVKDKGCFTFDLEFTGDEVKKCPFLGEKGCVLDEEEKPFDCKIWPLRVMDKDGEIFISLAKSCPAFSSDDEKIKLLAEELSGKITDYIRENPLSVKKYSNDYKILKKLEL